MAFNVKEYSQNRRKQNKTSTSFNIDLYSKYQKADKVGEDITNRINKWVNNNNNFINNFKNRYKDGNKTYRTDSDDWLNTISSQKSNFDKEAENIRKMLDAYKGVFDSKWVDSIYKALDEGTKIQGDIIKTSTDDKNFWSNFKDEKEFNYWYAKENFIDAYNKNPSSARAPIDYRNDLDAWKKEAGLRKEIETIKNSDDFEQYAQKGASIKNPSYQDAVGWVKVFGYPIGGKQIQNKVTFMQDENNYSMGMDSSLANPNLHFMNEDEVSVYNYYLGKGDNKKAEDFLSSINDDLNKRMGRQLAENAQKLNLEWLMAINTGLDQFASGLGNIDNFIMGSEADPISPIQHAGSFIRENINDDFWRGAWDLGVTISNQLPSILVGSVTGGVGGAVAGQVGGLATMGASVLGNSYAEMRRLGYDEWQSRLYAVMVTAAEVGLQHAMGGISKLAGGKSLSKIAINAINNVDNGIARVALKLGSNMLSEGIEEATQEVLDPIFKAIATTGEEWEGIDWGNVAYSGLLGALSAGALDIISGDTIKTDRKATKLGKAIKNAGNEVKLADYVKSNKTIFSADSVAAQIAPKITANTNAYQIGRLYQEAGATLSEQNLTDIRLGLEARHVPTKYAEKLASEYKAFLDGEMELTDNAVAVLEQCDPLTSAIREKLIDSNLTSYQMMQSQLVGRESDVYKRTREYTDLLNLANEVSGVTESAPFNVMQAPYSSEFIASKADAAQNAFKNESYRMPQEYSAEVKTNEKTAKESEFQWNPNGKTIYENKDVSIKGISSIKDGVVTVQLEDGRKVNAKDVSFSTEDEALMYDMVAKIGVNPETATFMMDTFNKGKGTVSAETYYADAPLAYQYGRMEYTKGLDKLNLTQDQKVDLFGRGRTDAMAKIQSNQPKLEVGGKPLTFKGKKVVRNGVVYEGVNPNSKKSDVQKAGIRWAELLSKVSSLEMHAYESYKDSNGNIVVDIDGETVPAPNGIFRDGNKIYIDINAGDTQQGTMLYTTGHEVGHYIKKWNAAEFKNLGDFLFENYKGDDVEELIAKKIDQSIKRYERKGMKIPDQTTLYDEAYEEIVCDSFSELLADENAYTKLETLEKQNKKLWETIGEALKNIINKIKKVIGAYKDVAPDSNALANGLDKESFNKLQDLYLKAFVKADENYQAAKAEAETDGVEAYNDTKGMQQEGFVQDYIGTKDLKFNERYAETHKSELAKKYDKKEARISLDEINKKYDKILGIWEKIGGELDSKFLNEWNNKLGKDRTFSVFKAQAGYKYNVELSSMCKKGVPLFEAIDTIVKEEIMKELKLEVLGKAEKEILYDILKSKSFEIPCAICYVEQARQREGAIIDAFLNGKIEKTKTGKITQFKLGWNEVIENVQEEMRKNGVDYTFPAVDRSIATDKYVAEEYTMDEATQTAFYNALKKVANKEISRYNEAEGKSRKLVKEITPSAIKSVFSGTLPSNLKIFKVLFQNPSSRFTIASDLLYSSMTTQNLAMAHNDLYGLFNSQGGVSGYKSKQGTIVYWGDILGKKWEASKLRGEGGVRNQSNSDFQMYTLLDQVQMYLDFSAKGYYLQAYTKVLAELKLFGLSSGKINASLIPRVVEYRNANGEVDVEKTMENAGLDEKGNPIYDDIEGINHKEAFMLIDDAAYSKSITGVCIGYSDNHINKLLDDPRVQLIIGFHDKTDDGTKRYRGARYAKNYNGLNEAYNIAKDETVHVGFNPFVQKAEKMFKYDYEGNEFTDITIEHNGKTYEVDDIPNLAADLYLEMCEQKGYKPAYDAFKGHPNYYKLLADFGLKDSQGHYAPHKKVAFNMPDSVPYLDINGKKKYMSTESYIKAGLEKELAVRDSIAEALADKSENGIIPQFKKKVEEARKVSSESDTKLSDRDSAENQLTEEQELYSERDPDIAIQREKVDKILEEENAKLKEDNQYLKELVKLQRKVTHGTKFTKSSVETAAGRLMRYANAKGNKVELASMLHEFYEYIAKGYDLTWDSVAEKARPVIKWLQDNVSKTEKLDAYSRNDYDFANDMIEQDLLSKVYDSYWDVSTLHTVADSMQKEITRLKIKHRKKMDAIRDYHTERHNKLKKDHQDNIARLKQKYRDRNENEIKEVKQYYQESRTKAIEGRHKTEMRNKIKKVVSDLNRILNKGTKERNVKIELQESVKKALELSDILLSDEYTNEVIARHGVESVTDAEAELLKDYNAILDKLDPYKTKLEALNQQRKELKRSNAKDEEINAVTAKIDAIHNDADYKKLKAKLSNLNSKLNDVFVRERNRYNKANATSVMDGLISAYESLKDSKEDYIKNAYQSELLDRLTSLRKSLGNVQIKDMSLKDLKDIYDAYDMVKHVITNANQIFRNGQKESLNNRIDSVQSELNKMGKEIKDRPDFIENVAKHGRSFSWNNLRPVDAFERLGSKSFKDLFWDSIKAQSVYAKDIEEAKNVISKARAKYLYKKWDLKEAKTFKTANGLELKLTLGDMMSIYAYSFRDQAYDHMTIGGFTFDTGKTYKEKKNGITYTHTQLGKTYVVGEETIKQIINSLNASQKAYVKEVQSFLTDMGAKGNEVSRILYGIDIFNESHYFPLQSAKDYRSSVEQALNATQTMVSLKNTGMTKQTVPHANNPIVLKAFDDVVLEHIDKMSKYHAYVIPIENLQKVFNNVGQDANQEFKSTKALISSTFGEEAKAYFDQYITDLNGGGTISGAKNPLSSFFGKAKGMAVAANLSVVIQQPFAIVRAMTEVDAKYFAPFLNSKASKTDGKAYEEMKKYAPVAIIKEMGGFDVGSNRGAVDYIGFENSPFSKEKAAKKFQDATMFGATMMDKLGWLTIWKAVKREIAATRSDLVVGSDKFLNACGDRFTEVVTKTQVYDSVNTRSGYMRSKHDSVKYLTSFMGEPTVSVGMFFTATNNFIRSLQSKDKTKIKAAAKNLGKTYATLPIAGALTAIAKALVQAMRDEEEDESFYEKWIEKYFSNLKSDLNPLNSLPVFKDIMSIVEGWDVERPDMTLIADLITSIKKVFDEDASCEETLNAVGSFANIIGVPLKNVVRDIKGFIQTTNLFINGEKTTLMGIETAIKEGWEGKEIPNAQQLYEAIINGDQAQIDRVMDRFKDQEAAEKSLRSETKKKYLSGEIDSDNAMSFLTEYCGMTEDDAYWKVQEWTYELENGNSDEYSKYDGFFTAVETGKNIKAVVKEYIDNGVSKQTLAAQITNHYKPLYIEMSKAERAKLKGYLLNAYVLLGYKRSEKAKDIDSWVKG